MGQHQPGTKIMPAQPNRQFLSSWLAEKKSTLLTGKDLSLSNFSHGQQKCMYGTITTLCIQNSRKPRQLTSQKKSLVLWEFHKMALSPLVTPRVTWLFLCMWSCYYLKDSVQSKTKILTIKDILKSLWPAQEKDNHQQKCYLFQRSNEAVPPSWHHGVSHMRIPQNGLSPCLLFLHEILWISQSLHKNIMFLKVWRKLLFCPAYASPLRSRNAAQKKWYKQSSPHRWHNTLSIHNT